jgi:hypothetical protein
MCVLADASMSGSNNAINANQSDAILIGSIEATTSNTEHHQAHARCADDGTMMMASISITINQRTRNQQSQ